MSAAPKMLVFGGSFDPPHIGHMNLLQNAIAAVEPNGVLVIPSGMAPHKKASETPWELRAAMCRCFEPLFDGLVVSDVERRRTGKSYTYDTLRALEEMLPGRKWYLCIGGDMLESFPEWYRWRDVLAMATLVATGRVPEEGAALEAAADMLRRAGGRVVFADGPVVPAASADIRAAVARGEDVSALLPPGVEQIMRENRLYV